MLLILENDYDLRLERGKMKADTRRAYSMEGRFDQQGRAKIGKFQGRGTKDEEMTIEQVNKL